MFKSTRILVLLTLIAVAIGVLEAFQFGRLPLNNNACRITTPSRAVMGSSRNDDTCGEEFSHETGPDGDYCLLDLEAVADRALPTAYREGLERQNAARLKFGQAPLTPAQYVALQAQNRSLGERRLREAVAAAFAQFDANGDGVVTLQELKRGLEGALRTELSETAVRAVLDHFDADGDGFLQPDEFVTVDRLKVKLEAALEAAEEEADSSKGSPGGLFGAFFKNVAAQLENTCESNFDCERPEVCCDLGFRKMCCSSGSMAKNLQREYAYATVPVAAPQN